MERGDGIQDFNSTQKAKISQITCLVIVATEHELICFTFT